MATATIEKKKAVEPRRTPSRLAPELFTPKIQLSARDTKLILDVMDAPPKPNAKLKRAAARFKKLMAQKS